MVENENKKKNEEGTEKYQIIQEDATMAAFGYTNPNEVEVERPNKN